MGAVGALVAGLTIVGLGGTSGAAAKPAFRQPVGLDHFLCYGAPTDPTETVHNQFGKAVLALGSPSRL